MNCLISVSLTLWFGIGLHGATAWLPVHSALTQRSIERDWAGSKWLYDGVPGWIVLATVLYLVARAPKAVIEPPAAPGSDQPS